MEKIEIEYEYDAKTTCLLARLKVITDAYIEAIKIHNPQGRYNNFYRDDIGYNRLSGIKAKILSTAIPKRILLWDDGDATSFRLIDDLEKDLK